MKIVGTVCLLVMTLLLGVIFAYLLLAGVSLWSVVVRICAHLVGAVLGIGLLIVLFKLASTILKFRK